MRFWERVFELTFAVAQVLSGADGRHLNELSHVGLLVPDAGCNERRNDAGLSEGGPIHRRLGNMPQQTENTVLDLDIRGRRKQTDQVACQFNRRVDKCK
jgi:hypothetical protein